MVPHSRLIVLSTLACVVLALGCSNVAQTNLVGEGSTVNKPGGSSKAKAASFKGLVSLPGGAAGGKARVALVTLELRESTSVTAISADDSGKFSFNPAPQTTSLLLALQGDNRLLTIVRPLVVSDKVAEPNVTVSVASTLATAGILPLFTRKNPFRLEELSMDLFDKLVEAVAATNPTLDQQPDPRFHVDQFFKLMEKDAGVKAAYDALFGDLTSKFKKANPGQATPPPVSSDDRVLPSPGVFVTAPPTPTPSPTPTPDPNKTASPSPSPSATATTSAEPTVAPTATPTAVYTVTKETVPATDGAPNTSGPKFYHMGTASVFGQSCLLIPDVNRIWLMTATGFLPAPAPKFIDLKTTINGATSVTDVGGLAFDTDNAVVYALGTVDGATKLIKLTLSMIPSAEALAVTGTVPSSWDGHAVLGGKLYVASGTQHQIFSIDLATRVSSVYAGTGIQSTMTGSKPVGEATLNTPRGLAVEGDRLFICESFARRILVTRPKEAAPQIEVFAGSATFDTAIKNGPIQEAAFSQPATIFTEGKKLYVADQNQGTVREIDLEKGWMASFTGPGAENQATGANLVRNTTGAGKIGNTIYMINFADPRSFTRLKL